VGSKTDANVRAGTEPFLQPNEPILATLIASVRGHSQAMAGGVAGMVGGGRARSAQRAAEEAGFKVAPFMAFVLTPTRMLTVETGNGGKVKGLLNEFALSGVGPMEVKRVGLGASVTLMVNGSPVKLESRVGASREFADALAKAKRA
jgi:hypothetical protein